MILRPVFGSELPQLPSVQYQALQTQMSKLSAEELKRLQAGELIFFAQKVKGATWPMLFFFGVIPVSPQEAMAVFAAYETQKDYIPNLIRSEIIKKIAPNENHTSYELKVPWPLSNAQYVHHHHLQQLAQDHYVLTWDLVESNTTSEVLGKAEFLSYQNQTLFYYQNFVRPNTGLATLVESTMVSDVKHSLRATLDYIQKTKAQRPAELQHFITELEQALGLAKIKNSKSKP